MCTLVSGYQHKRNLLPPLRCLLFVRPYFPWLFPSISEQQNQRRQLTHHIIALFCYVGTVRLLQCRFFFFFHCLCHIQTLVEFSIIIKVYIFFVRVLIYSFLQFTIPLQYENKWTSWQKWQYTWIIFGRCPVWIFAWTPTVLTDVFYGLLVPLEKCQDIILN